MRLREINSDYAYKNLNLEIIPFEVDHYPVEPAYGYQIKVSDTEIGEKSSNLWRHQKK